MPVGLPANAILTIVRINLSADYKHFFYFARKFVAFESPPAPQPSLQKILQMYSSMSHGVTLKSLCVRISPRDSNIDER